MTMLRLSSFALIACTSCGGVATPRAQPDAEAADAPPIPIDAPPSLNTFSAPVRITELDTTTFNERGPTLTADMLEIFFVSDQPGGRGGTAIWTASRTSTATPFGTPSIVTAIDSADSETHPFVTGDGLQLYFSVAHANSTTGTDLYISLRANRQSAWSAPTLATELQSAADDVAVGISANGLLLALDSTRGGASGRDLYLSSRSDPTHPWGIPEGIAELDTDAAQKTPQLANGGRALWFVQSTATTGDDIFLSTRPDLGSSFGAPVAVAELNTVTSEDDPWVADNQRTIVFASTRGGTFDLFIATR
jgi:WD40 repeat protein